MAIETPDSTRSAPAPSVALAALGIAVAAFVSIWSAGSRRQALDSKTAAEQVVAEKRNDDAEDPRVIWRCEGVAIGDVVLSPDDAYLAAVLYKTVIRSIDDRLRQQLIVVDVKSGNSVFDSTEMQPAAISFCDSRRCLAVLSKDTVDRRITLKLYDIGSRALIFHVEVPNEDWRLTDFFLGTSSDGRNVALVAWDSSGNESDFAWDGGTAEAIGFNRSGYVWEGAGMSPDGQLLAHGGWPGPGIRISSAQLNDRHSRESVSFCLRPSPANGSWAGRLPAATSFSPDSGRYLIVYTDGTLLDWTIARGKEALPVQIGTEEAFKGCTALALSHSGEHVFYALDDGTIQEMRLVGK